MGISKIFGANLRRIRKSIGLRQSDLAAEFDVNIATIIRWESGENLPVADQIDQIATFLGMPAVELFATTAGTTIERPEPTLKEAIEVVTKNWDKVKLKVRAKPKK